MSCTNPLIAINLGIGANGKNMIKILSKYRVDETTHLEERYGRDNVLFLPCGHCQSCRIEYRKNWAVRCEMESFFHKDNCFLTLTYDDVHVKPYPKKEELVYFIRLLRDVHGIKCRYFGCGERGERTLRSHYHLILFGYFPSDAKYYGDSKSGEPMFISKFLDGVWKKGQVMVQDFTSKTASYVAGYVQKKYDQENFLIFSTHPGLGFEYMDRNLDKLFNYGNYVGKNGQVYKLPRYFEKIAERAGKDLTVLKIGRIEAGRAMSDSQLIAYGLQYPTELLPYKDLRMKDKLKRLKREL